MQTKENIFTTKFVHFCQQFELMVATYDLKNLTDEQFGHIIRSTSGMRMCAAELGIQQIPERYGTKSEIAQYYLVSGSFRQLVKLAKDQIDNKISEEEATEIADLINEELSAEILHLDAENVPTIRLLTSQKSYIQERIDALRKAVNQGKDMTDEKKERLLKKLNKFQAEFDKEVGDYFKIRGRLVDFGDALGDFGERAKPFTDRVKDLTDAFRTVRQEQLQLGREDVPKQIEDKSDEEPEA